MTGHPKEPRFIEPTNTLKIKVGHGGISPDLLKKSQEYIEKNPLDFGPFAQTFLKEIDDHLARVKKEPQLKNDPKLIENIAKPIMGLKANGGMFKYPLISMIADVGLQFIDKAKELNQDGIEIISAHNRSIALIISSRLRGYAGQEGQKITEELAEACNRYFQKYMRE
jgi:hypothetical protein